MGILLVESALAPRRWKNFFNAEKLVRFFIVGSTSGLDSCLRREGSLGVDETTFAVASRVGDDRIGRVVTLGEVMLILSACRSCSMVAMVGRLVMDKEGKIPSELIAGGRRVGDVVGRAGSVSGLDAYAESSPSAEVGRGDKELFDVSVVGVRRGFLGTTKSCDCCDLSL